MKKAALITYLVFLFFALGTQYSFAQRNLILDERFEDSTLDSTNFLIKGKWFSQSNTGGESTIVGDEHQGTVAFFIAPPKPDIFNSLIGQCVEGLSAKGTYRVSFAARAMPTKANQELSLYLRIKSDTAQYKFFAMAGDVDEGVLPISKIKLTSAWEYYSVDFDLSKTCKTTDAQSNQVIVSPACESDLNNFYISFSSDTENGQIRFTDVSMSFKAN